jgi:acyl-CoA reductase-like NAD-dependent aldehyde dehydrogenase
VDEIADRFVSMLAQAAQRMKMPKSAAEEGDAAIGPLSNPMQLGIVEDHVQDAVQKGAKVLAGGKRTGFGLFYEPTILDACTHEMRVVADETFGPVLAVMRVKDADDAVRMTNDSRYGLNASIWTRDFDKAQALANKLSVGTVFINNHALTGTMPFAPWTGVRDSGYGVANSEHALHTFTRPKTIFVDTGRKPDPWWLPADSLLGEIAERLARAQLGDVAAALKVPGLMSARQKKLLALVRGEK